MANSAFSGLTDRASGALSGLRNRFGGSRNQDYDQRGYDDYGYDDDYVDYNDYGEYGYDPDEPYDDYTDAQGIGEIRTRSVPSSPRQSPGGTTTFRVFTPFSTTGATSRFSPIMNSSATFA